MSHPHASMKSLGTHLIVIWGNKRVLPKPRLTISETYVGLIAASHDEVDLVLNVRLVRARSFFGIECWASLHHQVGHALAQTCIKEAVTDKHLQKAMLAGMAAAGLEDVGKLSRALFGFDEMIAARRHLEEIVQFAESECQQRYKKLCRLGTILEVPSEKAVTGVNPRIKGAILARKGLVTQFEAWSAAYLEHNSTRFPEEQIASHAYVACLRRRMRRPQEEG